MNNNEPIWQQHQFYMAKAIELAEQAYDHGEIPVGAVVVQENKIIGKGYNQTQMLQEQKQMGNAFYEQYELNLETQDAVG